MLIPTVPLALTKASGSRYLNPALTPSNGDMSDVEPLSASSTTTIVRPPEHHFSRNRGFWGYDSFTLLPGMKKPLSLTNTGQRLAVSGQGNDGRQRVGIVVWNRV
jgi:hypothetical protein